MEEIMFNDQQVTFSHVTVPSGYFDLDREQRRAFLRSLLNGMSPNEGVRKSSQKTDGTTNQRLPNGIQDGVGNCNSDAARSCAGRTTTT